MKAIYIGGQSGNRKTGGIKWKIYLSLIILFAITISVLKISAPTLVEKWINQQGAKSAGYAFSIRDTELSLSQGQFVLNDVKVFNSKTKTEILETPHLTVRLNWLEILRHESKKVSVTADQVDLTLSDDLTSEIKRVQEINDKNKSDLQLDLIEGKIAKLNIIEKQDNQSRTVVELKDVDLKINQVTPQSLTEKSEFSLSSTIAEGGKLNLTGKTSDTSGKHFWSIQGSLKQVPLEVFNKMAGEKLPFSFDSSSVNAQITAQSAQGQVSGEITPEVKRLNLIEEKPGIPTQVIARALTEDLTFSLPFTLKDQVSFQFAEVFSKLRNYRKYAGEVVKEEKAKKTGFWPF